MPYKKLEIDIEDAVVAWVKRVYGIEALKLNLTGNNGFPDRLYLIPGGVPLLHEYKKPGEELEPLQVIKINLLRIWGYRVEVYDNVAAAKESIVRVMEAPQLHEKGGKIPARKPVRRSAT